MSEKTEKVNQKFVIAFLGLMAALMVLSVRLDTLTTDEGLYIPTGYHYLTTGNARIGFEHPPLMREIAALPLLFLNLRPTAQYINSNNRDLNSVVWEFGDYFIHNQAVSPEMILLLTRIPMVLFTVLFLYLVFTFSYRELGFNTAILSLLFTALSPYVLAHGRLVTLDVPTASAALTSIYSFVMLLKQPSKKTLLIAGLALGISQLIKFSMLALVPFLALVTFLHFLIYKQKLKHYVTSLLGTCILAFLVVYVYYSFHLFDYSSVQHSQDIAHVLSTTRGDVYKKWDWLSSIAHVAVLRPFAHYLFGVIWQFHRDGAFGYFMGEGSNTAWFLFYPVGFFVKQSIGLHVLLGISLFWFFKLFKSKKKQLGFWLKNSNFFILTALAWIFYYLCILIFANSGNTGSRYLLPILPFTFILISFSVLQWIKTPSRFQYKSHLLTACVLVYAISSLISFPSFLTYFNEFIGPIKGSKILVDTDVDWGQDTRRLALWLEKNAIPQIRVPTRCLFRLKDSNAQGVAAVYSNAYSYYLKNKMISLEPGVPARGWIAIPARLLRWGQAHPAKKAGWFSLSYRWLEAYQPVTVIGNSIYIYNIP